MSGEGGPAMTQTQAGEPTRANLKRLQSLGAEQSPSLLHHVRSVLLVQSASRGGSSWLTEALRHNPEFLHLQGETTPLLTAAQLTTPWNGEESDALPTWSAPATHVFAQQVALDLFARVGSLKDHGVRERFVQGLCWRLAAQWPEDHIERGEIEVALEAALSIVGRDDRSSPRHPDRLRLLHGMLLRELRRTHPRINPWYYDLPPHLVTRWFPDVPMPSGPPSRLLVEEPPFILICPTEPIAPTDLEEKPVILKSPSNAFRLPFFRAAFPNATIRIIHLSRDAESSITSLAKGWLHHGFHSHRLPGQLQIAGYCDEVETEESQWWKFDLPPGWQEWAARPLLEVCAWQWETVHHAILDESDEYASETIRVHFEDLVQTRLGDTRPAIRLAEWLGMRDPYVLAGHLAELPSIMAARAPSQAGPDLTRSIAQIASQESVARMRSELGYHDRGGARRPPHATRQPRVWQGPAVRGSMGEAQPATFGGPGFRTRTATHDDEMRRRMYWAQCGVRSEWQGLKSVLLTSPIGWQLGGRDPDAHLLLQELDPVALSEQFGRLRSFFESRGIRVHTVTGPLERYPNLIFVRDLFTMTGGGAIIARTASQQRAGEERYIQKALADLGVPILFSVRGGGHFEGADLVRIDEKTAVIGLTRRTNREGAQVVADHLLASGQLPTLIDLPKASQHLLGVLNFLDAGLAAVDAERVPTELVQLLRSHRIRLIELGATDELQEGRALNFVTLGPRQAVMSQGCPQTRAQLEHEGVTVAELDVSEYVKGGGGLACATGVLWRDGS